MGRIAIFRQCQQEIVFMVPAAIGFTNNSYQLSP